MINQRRCLRILMYGVLVALVTTEARAQDYKVQVMTVEVAPNKVTATLTARAATPLNPEFFVNRKQTALRDHHLVKTPPIKAAPAAAVRGAAIPTQPATDVSPLAESPVKIVVNHGLDNTETGGITSTVCEPSVAASKSGHVLVTGNWFAAFSKDDGKKFSYVSPYETFPQTDGHQFCCDQVALYDPQRDIMFWFLQYTQNGSSNKIRLAVAKGPDIASQSWQYYDFTPQSLGGWTNEWFDFPDLALGKDFIYISTNSFATQGTLDSDDDEFARAVMLRLPLAPLAEYKPAAAEHFSRTESFSFRPTQGATKGTMHFGSHDFNDFGRGIEVFSWPEASGALVTRAVVKADLWSNAARNSIAKDGRAWMSRTDFRMTAAWAKGNEVAFAWTAAQDATFKHPHVRVAVVDLNTKKVIAQPHLFNDKFAYG